MPRFGLQIPTVYSPFRCDDDGDGDDGDVDGDDGDDGRIALERFWR